jgi:flavin reductase (DIM6/NTAB) family NADH-FMN oxidoreductase RutF
VIIEPDAAGFSNVYKVMVGSIVPRPIAFVSTVSPEGIYNLAPFSFFTGASANPPVVCFCPMRNAEGLAKDTLNNVERTGGVSSTSYLKSSWSE